MDDAIKWLRTRFANRGLRTADPLKQIRPEMTVGELLKRTAVFGPRTH